MRLIDADVVAERVDGAGKVFDEWVAGAEDTRLVPAIRRLFESIKSFVDNVPTTDAVPVVRCGECVSHGNCLTEDTFRIARIKNPYCCGAKRREVDGEEEPKLIPNLCKHASSAKKNEIGETVVYCEMCAAWQNVTLGDCYGNCECQEVCDE